MESEVPVASPLEQPQDIGAAAAPHSSEDPPSGGDDGFETASDPDADDSAALPAAPVALEDEDSTDENPNLDGNSPAKSSPPALSADAGVVNEEKATDDVADEKLVLDSGELGPVAAVDEPDAAEPVGTEEKKAVGDAQDENFEDAPEEVEELVPVGSLADRGVTVALDEGDVNSLKEEVVVVAGDEDGVADDAPIPAEVDGNLEIDENPESKVLGVEEEGTDSGLLKEENHAAVEDEPQIVMVGTEEKGVPDTGDEKEKSLVDGESAPVADTDAEGAVVVSEPEMKVPDAGKVVAGVGKEEALDAVDENSEESPSIVVEGVDESKTVGDVIAIGSDGVPDALNEKEEILGVSGSQPSSTVQGSEGSSSLRDELVAADDAGSKQNLEAVADLKALGVESDAAIEGEKDGGAVAEYQSDILNEELDSKSVETESSAAENEKAVADSGASSVQGLVMVNDSSLELPALEVSEPRVGPAGAENGEVSTEGSLDVDFESARSLYSADKPDGGKAVVGVGVDVKDGFVSEEANDSADKHDIGSDGVGVVDEGVPESSNLFSVQGVDSSPVLGEKSKSEDVEPVFFSDRAVKSEAVGAQADGQGVEDEKAVPESSDITSLQGVESSPVLEVSKSGKVEPVSFSDRAVKPEAVRAQPDGEGVEDEKMAPESTDVISVQGVESSPVPEDKSNSGEVEPVSFLDRAVKLEAAGDQATAASTDDENLGLDETEEEDLVSEGPARVAILESSETAKLLIKEMEEGSASSHSGFRSSGEHSEHMDGQIVSDSEEEADTDEEGEGRELFDSAALTALLRAATGSSADGGVTISQDGTRIFSVDRPAGLGSSIPALRPASLRSSRPSPFSPSDLSVVGEPENNMDENEKKLQEKVEQIRIKFLRLVQRLGHSPDDTVAAQVLYRLGLAEGIRRGRQIGRAFSIESTKKKALQLEEDEKEDLDFSCNILVLGKTGVGKSATINSIFGESKSRTSAFLPATTSVREITGTVDGVKIRVIDTPGLRASVMDQAANMKVLQSIKKYTKRCPPDIVLYVDRIDTQTRDFNDLPLLKSVTTILGSSIWFNAIVALSHAASAPPDGPSGSPLSYEVFVAQRSHVVQHSIRQAAGDMRLMNPVALVENHPSCRRNREGERVLPNGLSWRPQLLLLCYSSKILSEANSLLKLQDPSPGKLFGFRFRSPPLPYLLSSLLQSRTHPKLSTDQGGDNGDSDIDLDDLSDADQEEEEDEYDQLPPFKPLRKSQIAKLTKDQRGAYFDEYDYRVKLLQKKQWKEELRRMKEAKIKGKTQKDDFAYVDMMDDYDQDGAPAAVPVPLPDMVLPPSFDCNNPVYRYRFLEPTSQLLIRPVLDSHGFDHDCGYDGVSIEENLAVAGRFPAVAAVQITKDKKEFNLHLDSSISAKHGENGSSIAGFDIQSIGKQLAYIVRGETKFKNLKRNKTAAGVSVTFLGETIATGLKVEDQISIGKRVNLVASAGGVRAQGDVAYGANLEARLRDKDYPLGQTLSTLGLSLMKWRNDLALGANLQSQFSIGRNSKMSVRVGLNNKLSGQITVRTSTSEQLQIALVAILPLAISFFRSISPGESYMVN